MSFTIPDEVNYRITLCLANANGKFKYRKKLESRKEGVRWQKR